MVGFFLAILTLQTCHPYNQSSIENIHFLYLVFELDQLFQEILE